MKASLSDCPGFISALEHSPLHLISSCSPTGDVQYISPSARSLLGYESQDLLSPGVFGQGPAAGEIFFRPHRDGSNVRFQNTFRSESASGDVYTIDQVLHVEENAIYCTLIIDSCGVILSCDCRAEMSDRMVGESISSVTGDKLDQLGRWLANARSGNSQLNIECTMNISSGESKGLMDVFYRTDGAVVAFFRLSAAQLDPERVQNGLYDTDCRITELQDEINYLRDFRDHASLPMFSVNRKCEIYWANEAMLELMGYTEYKEEYLNSPTKMYHVDQALVECMVDALKGKQILRDFPCKLRRRDGAILDVTFNSSALFDSSGNFMHTRCIVQDVTEHKRLQADREALQQERQRAQLGEILAKKASELKSKFLATMTHEIRTPMNGVIGAASLLATTGMTAEQKDYVDTINASSDVLLSLIHNILDITKIESGKLELETVPTNISKLVAKACRVVQSKADDKGVALIVDISPELEADGGWFMADPTRMNQVILNFLSNAIKFSHVGSVTCRVDQVRTDVESDVMNVRIEVIDTGIGVENPSILFHEFVQANASITQTYGGTGLGLSISKKLVELMGGEVGMTSVVGQGSTVWARIPLRKTNEPRYCGKRADNDKIPLHNILEVEGVRDGIRVLIAEDNKVNQKIIKRMLEKSGYSDITVVDNGAAAVDCFKHEWESKRKFDIVLMDCQMPIMNGWDATTNIRSFEKHYIDEGGGVSDILRTIIIALTANATESDKKRSVVEALFSDFDGSNFVFVSCLDCGMDDFCSKPITRNQIMTVMSTWETNISNRCEPE